jgi:hypothetical protein
MNTTFNRLIQFEWEIEWGLKFVGLEFKAGVKPEFVGLKRCLMMLSSLPERYLIRPIKTNHQHQTIHLTFDSTRPKTQLN